MDLVLDSVSDSVSDSVLDSVLYLVWIQFSASERFGIIRESSSSLRLDSVLPETLKESEHCYYVFICGNTYIYRNCIQEV